MPHKPDVTEVKVVSVSSGEPSNLAEVAQPSRVEGPTALMWVEQDLYQWGGPRLTWSDQNQLEAPLVFMLDDIEEQGYWDKLQVGCQTFNQTMSSALSTLHDEIRPVGQVRRAR
jgi:hypothetical protein